MISWVPQDIRLQVGILSFVLMYLTHCQHAKKNTLLTSDNNHNPSIDRDTAPEDGVAGTERILGAAVFGTVGACVGVATGGGVSVVGK